MTSNHDQDAFEFRFEGAVDDMHRRTHHGSSPSARVWQTIRAGLPEATSRAETADPRAAAVDPAPVSRKTQRMRKESDMDMTLNPGMAAPPPSRAHRGLFAWAAIALVGMLMASSLFWYGQTPPGNDGNELAWAPGMGTPDATATVDRMCEAEPLTTDDVMSILLNPLEEYERRGQTFDYDDAPFDLYESQPPRRDNWTSVAMTGTVDPDLDAELASFGNEFWNCLITGTTFQVWSYMDPGFLQWSILREFPVLRAEDQMRAFVEEWGPQKYTSFPHGTFPNYVNVPIEQAAHIADRSEGSIRVSIPRGLPGQETRIGIITMVLESGHDPLNYLEIYISEHPDGSWSVNGIGANPNTPRG